MARLETLREEQAKRQEKLKREQQRAREAERRVAKMEDRLRGTANEGLAHAVKEICGNGAEVIKVEDLRLLAAAKLAASPEALLFLDKVLPLKAPHSAIEQNDRHMAGERYEADYAVP